MAPIRGPAWALCTLGTALLFLTGCDKLTQGESKWARAALERNPDITIVAADEEANTFTVQVKGSSELRVVRMDEIIGAIPSDGSATAQSTERTPAGESAPPVASTQPPVDPEPYEASAEAGEPARPADAPPAARNFSPPVNPGMASGTAVIRNASGQVIASSENENAPAGDNKVLASGPGYSISAGEPRANRPIRLAQAEVAVKSPANAAVERRYEPMICQGNRLLRIDGRNLEFEGDAVSALDGCEIHITNSHIIARGVGVSARAANVHIKNSIIQGDSGSVSASDGAKIYTQQSTFKGLSRRLDTATFTDLGGTTWN
jgi:hypothetical protein